MNVISTHVLDTARGKPASGIPVKLEREDSAGKWQLIGGGQTTEDGRCAQLLPQPRALSTGRYRLTFDTAKYFASHNIETLYPFVEIAFSIRDGESHFHIPLLLSPNGYTTYRGS